MMVKKMLSRDGNELEDPGCLLRQLEDAAPVVRSVRVIILYAHANPSIRGNTVFHTNSKDGIWNIGMGGGG